MRQVLQQSLEGAVAALSRLRAISAEVSGEPETSDTPFWRMTISAGEHHARAPIAWLQESLATLDAATDPPS